MFPRHGHDFGSEECLERLGQGCPHTVFIDVEPLEEHLVQQASRVVVSLHVRPVPVASKVERNLEIGLDGVEVGTGGLQPAVGGFQPVSDPVLLSF